MRRHNFIVVAFIVSLLTFSCSRDSNSEVSSNADESIDIQESDSLKVYFEFETDQWINCRLELNSFTQSQANCLRSSLQTVFERLSSYVCSNLVKRSQWKALHNYEQWTYWSLRRTVAKKIKFLDRLEYESLFNSLNECLLEGDVSLKSCEFMINESILRYNDSHESEMLQTISLPRIPANDIINSELVKYLYLYLDDNYLELKRKDKRIVELSLLVNAICKQYADVFDDSSLFSQTLK